MFNSEIPADITLRPAVRRDARACATILNDWIDATDWMPRVHSHSEVEQYYRDVVFDQGVLIVADLSGDVKGFMSLDESGFVTALYLAPDTRRQGIGTALLERARLLRPDGLRLWAFKANRSAQIFYEKNGFSARKQTLGDNEEGLPDILYEWRPE